jgi:hypothetical protein
MGMRQHDCGRCDRTEPVEPVRSAINHDTGIVLTNKQSAVTSVPARTDLSFPARAKKRQLHTGRGRLYFCPNSNRGADACLRSWSRRLLASAATASAACRSVESNQPTLIPHDPQSRRRSLLATDKTGTLTQDNIILEHHIDVSGYEDKTVLELAWLNSAHQSGLKNLLDVAVIKYSELNLELRAQHSYKKIDELPFDFVRRRMSVIVQGTHGEHLLVCKGAVEETLGISAFMREGHELVPLDDAKRQQLMTMTRQYNEDGFRVLAVATREFAAGTTKSLYAMDQQATMLANQSHDQFPM